MLSTTTKTINATLLYSDYSERTYKIPMTDEATDTTAKEAIIAFNEAAQNNNIAITQTFISDNGAPVTGIKDAVVIRTTEDVIYSG